MSHVSDDRSERWKQPAAPPHVMERALKPDKFDHSVGRDTVLCRDRVEDGHFLVAVGTRGQGLRIAQLAVGLPARGTGRVQRSQGQSSTGSTNQLSGKIVSPSKDGVKRAGNGVRVRGEANRSE